MARLPRAGILGGALLLVAPACQGDEDPTAAVTSRPDPARERMSAFESEPTVPTLLAVLGSSHRDARRQLGAHRLHYTGSFELRPVEDPGRPRVGQPVLVEQSVDDESTLEWGSAIGEAPAFRLDQRSDTDPGREVVLLDDKLYTQMRPRAWFWRELDSELHELWLDDAMHCMFDAVALAAPGLQIGVDPAAVESDAETLSVELSLAEGVDKDLIHSEPSTTWRHRAQIDEVSGTIAIDRATGTWRSGEVEVAFSLADALGRKLRGRVRVEGTLEPVAAGQIEIRAPSGALALPERERYELERAKLLDGLAAP